MLYHLLTGAPPFEGTSVAHTLHKLLHDEVAPPRRFNATVPPDLETICLKCLEKLPARRYGTARELADELGRFLRGEPIQARRISRLNRIYRWTQRNPTAAALFATMVVTIGVLVGLIKVLHDRSQRDLEAMASIRALVVGNIEEMWQRPDKMSERISSEQLAALAGQRKKRAPVGTRRLTVGLGATQAPVDRAIMHQPMLDFMERRMEKLLRRPVRLDLVLSKDTRLDKPMAQDGLHLVRIGTLAFFGRGRPIPG